MMEEKRRRSEDDQEEEEGVVKTVTAAGAGNKNKRDEWSEAGILTLLEAYESKWSLRNRAKLKGSDWEEIAFHVSSTASLKNPNQCKNKIESMKKKYRLESNSNSRPSSWPFYSRMHQLLHPFKVEDGETNNHHAAVVEGSNNHNNESEDEDETAPAPAHPPPVVEKREDEAVGRRKRKGRFEEEESENEYLYLGESIRLLGRCIMKIEQGRIDMYRECEKMRLESEMKRAELDFQRTQIVASTQLQIANLFANTFLNNNNNNNNNNNTAATQPRPSSLVDTTATTTTTTGHRVA